MVRRRGCWTHLYVVEYYSCLQGARDVTTSRTSDSSEGDVTPGFTVTPSSERAVDSPPSTVANTSKTVSQGDSLRLIVGVAVVLAVIFGVIVCILYWSWVSTKQPTGTTSIILTSSEANSASYPQRNEK